MKSNRKIESLQHQSWIALSNAERVDDIRAALDAGGFGQTRRDDLRQLMQQVKKRVKLNNTAYEQKTDLTGDRADQHEAMDQLYAMHRRQARRVLQRDSPPYRKLGLDVERSRRLSVWFPQIRTFYSLLRDDEDCQAVVNRYRLSPEFLTQTLQQIDALEQLAEAQQAAIDKARQSTQARDATVDELELLYLDMRDIALRMLQDQPHYLAAMGFISTEPAQTAT
jgi:hypothetical protein